MTKAKKRKTKENGSNFELKYLSFINININTEESCQEVIITISEPVISGNQTRKGQDSQERNNIKMKDKNDQKK